MNIPNDQSGIQHTVRQLEEVCVVLFNRYQAKTNQYSTKFVLQKAAEEYQVWKKEIFPLVERLGHEVVSDLDLDQLISQFEDAYPDEPWDSEYLNFVEAKEMMIHIMEFVIAQYNDLIESGVSPASEKILTEILDVKNKHLNLLKSEYEKVRYK